MRQQVDTRIREEQHLLEEDTGLFESAADFFSLVSLVVICFSILHAQAFRTETTVEIVEAVTSSSGEGAIQQADPSTAYVAFIQAGTELVVRMQLPGEGSIFSKRFVLDELDVTVVAEGISRAISGSANTSKVIGFISKSAQPLVHKTFLETVDQVEQQGYSVRIVIG